MSVGTVVEMAVDPPSTSRQPPPVAKAPQVALPADAKRGANRSTKVAGKLKVLPDQPDVPTQSKILGEVNKAPLPPPTSPVGERKPTDSDEDDADEEDEGEETEETDAVVCLCPS